ncbi:MAG: rRNA maturation RNase YbeY [Clostridia bacterium]|nr:rRNA maturation RNase YbeY [Clostridia bacterium]
MIYKHYTPDIPQLKIYFSAEKEFSKHNYLVKKVIREAIRATLFSEKFDANAEVSVTLCGADYIRAINMQYREKDTATDVLSFPMYTKEEIEAAKGDEDETVELGDIVLSLPRAEEQAKEIGHSFLHEVAFLTVHSVLHLLGYDHELSPEEEEKQCQRQKAIMEWLVFPDEEGQE